MKIIGVVDALERFAPLPLQEDYDNAGLQVGLTEAEVSGALLCLDVTETVLDEAMENGCNLIVSHHPLIFHRLAHITGEDEVQRVVMKAVRNDVAIVSMHTNLDAAVGGVNYKIASKMNAKVMGGLGGHKEATADDGTVVSGNDGVMALLKAPMAADDFMAMLKEVFDVECVMANELLRRPIQKVAICGGAGDFLLPEAVKAGADAFVTGEMHYHQYFGHEQELQIAVIGHYQSEQFTKEIFREIIERSCPGVRCVLSGINTNPILYF
ncbi:Nif3-like dinuclear metal center hexameric protein [Hallella multisaccharivorax]|uniref:Nif3-like dinuclear metal center hexameric protein n=1 Tax=Hallella multisaccharivorax TaxID=310514 RepID=UPI00361E9062